MIEKSSFGFWAVTFGPLKDPTKRSEIRKWARQNCKQKFTVDITCFPGVANEFWTFDDEKEAFTFYLKWGHL
jgi:hypothetical protein